MTTKTDHQKDLTCDGTWKDFEFYGYPFHDKHICMKCGREHQTKLPLSDKIKMGLGIVGIPAIFTTLILATKVFWCIWLSDNNCWSHFP